MPASLHEFDKCVARTILNGLLDGLNADGAVDLPETIRALPLSYLESTSQQILHAFCVVKNSKAPVNNVIDDILYRIFSMAVLHSKYPARQTLSISQVCRHWRNRALDYPSLWGFMDPEVPHISTLFLKRSGQAPISLAIVRSESPFGDPRNEPPYHYRPFSRKRHWHKYMPTVIEIVPRLRSLALHLDISSIKAFCEQIKGCVMPLQLHTLDIDIVLNQDGSSIDPVEGFQVPKIFMQDINCIDSLKLTHITIPWNNAPVLQLTRLSLIMPSTSPTPHQLISLFITSPDLEELVLYGLSHPNVLDLQTMTEIPRIPLRRLWRLYYYATHETELYCLQAISRSIQTSNLRSIHIELHVRDFSLPMTPHPILLIPSGSDSFATSLEHLYLRTSSTDDPAGRSSYCYAIKGRFHSDGPSFTDTSIYGFFMNNKSHDAALSLIGHIPTEQNTPAEPYLSQLHTFIKTLSNVRRLELETSCRNYLLPDSGIDISSSMPHISALELYTRVEDHLNAGHAPVEHIGIDSLISPRVIRLESLLLHNFSNNLENILTVVPKIGIKSLDINQCSHIAAEDVKRLKDMGVQVHWSEEMTYKERAARWPVD